MNHAPSCHYALGDAVPAVNALSPFSTKSNSPRPRKLHFCLRFSWNYLE